MLPARTDQKADEDNFRYAIDAALAARPMYIDVPMESLNPADEAGQSTLPLYVALSNAFAPTDPFKSRTEPLDALTSAGLLAAKTGTLETATMFAGSNDKVAVKIYDLIDLGRKALDKPGYWRRSFFASSRDRFCYGTPEVATIGQFTEPAEAFGREAFHVSYTCELHMAPQEGCRLSEAAGDRRGLPASEGGDERDERGGNGCRAHQ